MNQKQIEKSPILFITLSALGIALTYVVTAMINLPIPGAAGGLIHLGQVPLFLFALVFGKKIGAISGGIGMALFDLLSPYAIWAPFTLVISGLMGFVTGALEASSLSKGLFKNPMGKSLIAMLASLPIKIAGYYLAEGFLYRNWIVPVNSIPSNGLQVVLAAIIVLPLLKPMKRAARRIVS